MTILLTGAPGNKTDVLIHLKGLYEAVFESPLATYSCGNELGDVVSRHDYNPRRLPHMRRSVVQGFRSGIPAGCALSLARQKANGAIHSVVETPLTEYSDTSIEDTFEDDRVFDVLAENPPAMPIERVVCSIDDPRQVLKRLSGSTIHHDYDTDDLKVERILQWQYEEVKKAKRLAKHYTPDKRALIVPRHEAVEATIKLLVDPESPVFYTGFALTHALKNPNLMKRVEMDIFKLRFMGAVLTPIIMADVGPRTRAEEIYTIKRDYGFVEEADVVFGIFPEDVPSKGFEDEFNHARYIGKTTVLIHPKKDRSPFGRPTYHFTSMAEFISALYGPKEKYPELAFLVPRDAPTLASRRYDGLPICKGVAVSDEKLAALEKSLEQPAG